MTGSGHGVTEVLGVMRTLWMRNNGIRNYGKGWLCNIQKNGDQFMKNGITTTIFVNTLYEYFESMNLHLHTIKYTHKICPHVHQQKVIWSAIGRT